MDPDVAVQRAWSQKELAGLREVTVEEGRRLAVRAQVLDGSARGVLSTIRRLGFLQLDPIATVATPQELVLWSRLGTFDRGELDREHGGHRGGHQPGGDHGRPDRPRDRRDEHEPCEQRDRQEEGEEQGHRRPLTAPAPRRRR